jgi:hypothetical protein
MINLDGNTQIDRFTLPRGLATIFTLDAQAWDQGVKPSKSLRFEICRPPWLRPNRTR